MKCKICRDEMPRQRVQHERWRLLRRGYTNKQARDVIPLCHNCMNIWLAMNYKDFCGRDWSDYKVPERFLSTVRKF